MTQPIRLLDLPAAEAARVLALDLLDSVVAARARLGQPEDSEALHDFRVSLRRLRSCLRSYRAELGDSVPGRARRELRKLARAAGESRDIEVYQAWVAAQEPMVKAYQRPGLAWLKARLQQRRARADRRLHRRVERDFADIERRLRDRLPVYRARVGVSAVREGSLAAVLARLVLQLAGELQFRLGLVRSIADQHEIHEVRIAAKRLRYLLEPVAPELELARDLVTQLVAVQDTLGELHDAHVFALDLRAAIHEAALAQAERVSRELLEWSPASADEMVREDDPRLGLLALGQRLRESAETAYARFHAEWLIGSEAFFVRVGELAHLLERHALPPMEIERKYLLSGLPPEAAAAPFHEIDQGWLPGERLVERFRRVRVDGREEWYRTVKLGHGLARVEIEEATTRELFETIWPLTEGCRVRKRRHRVPAGDLVWEIDAFADRDLVLAEVELPHAEAVAEIPAWLAPYLVREVTDDPAYVNRNLAR
ncbi:MAG TPA: CHAD domain-containing protein [Gemmatimonadales bacterium]|nr:CHAD domain-containing protein [Gemmatimonadales bacterium]